MPDGAADPAFTLDLLAPKYEPSHHALYVSLLRRELEKDGVRNIAVTGAYGTGKSSVLEELIRDDASRERSLAISLSSLGLDDATTRDGGESREAERTNQIQKEIVKQILYTVHPSDAPRSRFDRTSGGRGRDGLKMAVLVGAVAAAAIVYGRDVVEAVVHGTGSPVLTFVGSFLLVASVAYVTRRVMRGRVSLEQLEAGPASISLSTISSSFFDEFLDEIVYFFEVTEKDLVIFEDIDRFDNVGIFETLRSLNTLLNRAPQLRRRPVRFIYAMRDSVFQKLETQLEPSTDEDAGQVAARGSAATEADVARDDIERANRTKFFDVVIPIVPFISRENARDIMTREFRKDTVGVSDRLLNIVARHIADMRLVTNIRNEFKIFHHHLIAGEHPVPDLDADHLLAIVVYKNVHLGDFERIRLGTSNLDALYTVGRELVADQVGRDTKRLSVLRSAVENQDRLTHRAAELGERLDTVLQGISASLTRFDGLAADAHGSVAFWQSVSSGVEYRLVFPGHRPVPASRALLEVIVRDPLTAERWDAETRPTLEREIVRLDAAIKSAIRGTWEDLFRATARRAASNESAAKVQGETFAAATRRLLRSDLAADLVEHGYLDEYFSLYIAPFYGEQISRHARTFIQRHIDRGVPDELYLLDAKDTRAILRDRPHALEDVGIYNVSILDHLLEHDRASASAVIGTITRMGPEQSRLLEAYVERGVRTEAFIEVLTPQWPMVFTFLAEDASVDPDRLLPMFDKALRSWVDGVAYLTPQSVRAFIEENHVQLTSLSGPHSTARAAEIAIRAGAHFFTLTPIGDAAIPTIRDADAYEITAPNLHRVTGLDELSLDAIASLDPPTVFGYVEGNLGEYLDATPGLPTARDAARFAGLLTTLGDQQSDLIDRVIAGAATDCVIADLKQVPQPAWAPLASHGRFEPTISNLHTYIAAEGVDGPLASLLEAAGPVDPADERSAAMTVQVAIVNARQAIADPRRRVELANQIRVDEYLDVSQIPREPSDIVSILLEHDLIEDVSATFAPAMFVNGATFAQAVAASEEFAEFMTPALVPVDRLADLMTNPDVDAGVKDNILANFDEYTPSSSSAALQAVAEYARSARTSLSAAQLVALQSGGVDDRTIVALIVRSDLAGDPLVSLLLTLDTYAETARPGRPRLLLPDDDDHRDLVGRLKNAGIVSSHRPNGHGSIEVWRRHPAS